MVFWNTLTPVKPVLTKPLSLDDSIQTSQQRVFLARRRLLGTGVLLLLVCSLLPWVLDSAPRPWREDVILRMPKNEQPYQATLTTDKVFNITNPSITKAPAPAALPATPVIHPPPSTQQRLLTPLKTAPKSSPPSPIVTRADTSIVNAPTKSKSLSKKP